MDAFRHCEALVREADKDRFLATLFAPAQHRDALYALYAFDLELSHIRDRVSGPLPGEIRLQWWTEVVLGARKEEAEANPVAHALQAVMASAHLPISSLEGQIEAHRADVYDEPLESLAALEANVRDAAAPMIAAAARVLNSGHDGGIDELSAAAGTAYGLVQWLRAVPHLAHTGFVHLPSDLAARHGLSATAIAPGIDRELLTAALADIRMRARQSLVTARPLLIAAPDHALPALLPVALSRLWLDRMDVARDPLTPVEIPQWRRQWALWRAARRPRQMFG